MLDLAQIRKTPELVKSKLLERGVDADIGAILALDEERRRLLGSVEDLKRRRNETSKAIAKGKKEGRDMAEEISAMRSVGEKISGLDEMVREIEERTVAHVEVLPNLPHDSVTPGADKSLNSVVRTFGEKPEFDFPVKNHVQIAGELDIIDFSRGARIAGSQFALYKGVGARLEWALLQYMIDVNTMEKDYELILPPAVGNRETLYASGQLPKFADQVYHCEHDDLYLIPTAEVALNSMHRGEILKEKDLPLKYAAFTPCFRREAGTYGAGERGLIRVHQFQKVELFAFTKPEDSYEMLETITRDAEDLVCRLGLHYKLAGLVAGDLGQQAAKTYDVEIWLPGQRLYYEVSSVSNCEDYQARRGSIRYRPADSKKTVFVHTLNGSALATSRLLVGILETYQRKDGSVMVPDVLRPYMGGLEVIAPS